MGAEVPLITRSAGEEEDARALGAHNVVASTDIEQMAVVNGCFGLVIDTVPYKHDINHYVATLQPAGTLVMIGHFGAIEPALNSTPLMIKRRAVAGSFIGGIRETQEMLDFCGEEGIVFDIEMIDIPADQCRFRPDAGEPRQIPLRNRYGFVEERSCRVVGRRRFSDPKSE
ncbi:zinc-binding dehydrogenase [Paraburkholderia caribensis]|uniref:zinc-binding dehydrogenase n=1 Tax=Paraburkholderia caribensis TaxID=75105 RepID=UPI0034D1E11B